MMELRKETTLVCVFFVAAIICRVLSGQTQCTIGHSDDSELEERDDERFYLDVNNPATCNGNITNWTVCYYGRSDSGFNSYWATYAVYQRVGSGGNETYERVSEMFSAVTSTLSFLIGDGLNQMGFNCYTDSIDAVDSPLTIHAGDIIGACVFDPEDGTAIDRRQLNVVGEVRGQGASLMRTSNADGCTRNAIPSSIPLDDLREQNNRRLHIYANIEPEPLGIETPVTTPDNQVQSNGQGNESGMDTSSDQESGVSPVIIAAGSASGVVIICIALLALIIICVIVLKERKKAFHFTSNIAYTGRCNQEDVDYYSIPQWPQAGSVINQTEMKESSFTMDYVAADLEQTNCNAASINNDNMRIVRNVAYIVKPPPLSLNVAYESHVHQGTEHQEEYDYI